MPKHKIDTAALQVAMSIPDKDVPIPSRTSPGSLASQIAALTIGACASKVEPVDPALTIAEFIDQGRELREALRNRVTASVTTAKNRTGGQYSIEVGTLAMANNNIYLVAVITRNS